MNKSSQYILITEYKTNAANWKDIAIHVKRAYDKKNDYEHAVYVAHDESAVIEIISLSQLSEIDNVLKVSNRINQSVISSFVAYHSLISTEPGIMFLSCFDDNISEYQAGFESPEYKQIIKEAGTNFIAGGERGLYTTIYEQYHE
jgi:hypothetical protein